MMWNRQGPRFLNKRLGQLRRTDGPRTIIILIILIIKWKNFLNLRNKRNIS